MWNYHWSIMKPAYFIIWFSFNINFRFSINWCSRAQQVIKHKYVKYTCSMETVQQNGRFTLFSGKFLSIYSILYAYNISDLKNPDIFETWWTPILSKGNHLLLNLRSTPLGCKDIRIWKFGFEKSNCSFLQMLLDLEI